MATITSLPPELLSDIAALATLPSLPSLWRPRDRYRPLLSLSLVSSFFHSISQPLLYRRVVLEKNSHARLLSASSAFGQHRVLDLVLVDNAAGHSGVDNQTARELIKRCGALGLERLYLRTFHRLEAQVLDLAGPYLKNLVLATDLTGEEPADGWTFAFRLQHLDLRGRSSPPAFLSSLISSSPVLTSLDVSGHATPKSMLPLLDLPSYPALAAQITSLTLSRHFPITGLASLALFTSLRHLTFISGTAFAQIQLIVDHQPADAPTVEVLTLAFRRPALMTSGVQEDIHDVLRLKSMGRLRAFALSEVSDGKKVDAVERLGAERGVTVRWAR